MKLALKLSTFLMLAMFATIAHARSFQVPTTSHNAAEICDEARLSQLAACGCYVQATIPEAPKEEIGLCHEQYGDDLLSLKPHCKNFLDGDEVDTGAFTEAIVDVQKVCLPEMFESSKSAAGEDVVVKHTERILPFVIAAIIILYPTNAY